MKTALCLVGLTTALSSSVMGRAPISVMTTIEPLAFFIEEIGGPAVDVSVMIGPGGNPHTYEPTPGQMKTLSGADLYVKTGSGIEFETAWMDKLTALNPGMAVCDVSRGIQLIPMDSGHHHGDHDGHHHGSHDPHIWLSLNNAVIMAGNIRDCLGAAVPERVEVFQQNTNRLILRLDEMKRYAAMKLAPLERRVFLIHHPAWGYFAREFNLTQIAAEHLGKEPTPRQLAQVIRKAKGEGIRVVFASPNFSRKSAEVIAREIRGRVVFVDGLSRNYLENMRQAIEAFEMSLR